MKKKQACADGGAVKGGQGGADTNMHKRIAMGKDVTGMKKGGTTSKKPMMKPSGKR